MNQPDVLALIEPSLLLIDAMITQIKSLDKSLELLTNEKYPVTEVMRQITGVGDFLCLRCRLKIHWETRKASKINN